MDAPRFNYTASADGREDESFSSNVEYLAGDELPLSTGRWTVIDVEETGFTHWEQDQETTIRSRTLRCTVA